MTIEEVSQIAHEANRVLQASFGEPVDPHWEDADWRQESTRKSVKAISEGGFDPRAEHESWLKERTAQGWKYGPVKDETLKTNPAMVPYEQLPAEQLFKDVVRAALVQALLPLKLERTVKSERARTAKGK